MNASVKTIPASSNPRYLGRKVITEFYLYCEEKPGEKPVIKAELNDRATALAVLSTVNFNKTGNETYFLVQTTHEVIA